MLRVDQTADGVSTGGYARNHRSGEGPMQTEKGVQFTTVFQADVPMAPVRSRQPGSSSGIVSGSGVGRQGRVEGEGLAKPVDTSRNVLMELGRVLEQRKDLLPQERTTTPFRPVGVTDGATVAPDIPVDHTAEGGGVEGRGAEDQLGPFLLPKVVQSEVGEGYVDDDKDNKEETTNRARDKNTENTVMTGKKDAMVGTEEEREKNWKAPEDNEEDEEDGPGQCSTTSTTYPPTAPPWTNKWTRRPRPRRKLKAGGGGRNGPRPMTPFDGGGGGGGGIVAGGEILDGEGWGDMLDESIGSGVGGLEESPFLQASAGFAAELEKKLGLGNPFLPPPSDA